MKIVINTCFGGFGISRECAKHMADAGDEIALDGFNTGSFSLDIYPRDSKTLVKAVEELGKAANSDYSDLKVVEIPDDVDWIIDDYDGVETIHERERHRSWC